MPQLHRLVDHLQRLTKRQIYLLQTDLTATAAQLYKNRIKNACNRWTKVSQGHWKCRNSIGHISFPAGGLYSSIMKLCPLHCFRDSANFTEYLLPVTSRIPSVLTALKQMKVILTSFDGQRMISYISVYFHYMYVIILHRFWDRPTQGRRRYVGQKGASAPIGALCSRRGIWVLFAPWGWPDGPKLQKNLLAAGSSFYSANLRFIVSESLRWYTYFSLHWEMFPPHRDDR